MTKRTFASAREYMEKRMPHLVSLYTYTDDGSIDDLQRAFRWSSYDAFELDVFVCDVAKHEAANGALLFL